MLLPAVLGRHPAAPTRSLTAASDPAGRPGLGLRAFQGYSTAAYLADDGTDSRTPPLAQYHAMASGTASRRPYRRCGVRAGSVHGAISSAGVLAESLLSKLTRISTAGDD